jgi:hypothetical protein
VDPVAIDLGDRADRCAAPAPGRTQEGPLRFHGLPGRPVIHRPAERRDPGIVGPTLQRDGALPVAGGMRWVEIRSLIRSARPSRVRPATASTSASA